LTRRINLIADKALLAAFSENTHTLRPKHVEAAVRDSEFSEPAGSQSHPRFLWGVAVFAAGALLGIGGYWLLGPGIQRPPQPASSTGIGTPLSTLTGDNPSQLSPVPVVTAQPIESLEKSDSGAHSKVAAPLPVSPPVAAPFGERGASASRQVAVTDVTGAMGSDMLESRLAATEKWLASEAGNLYSIQLLGATDVTQLKLHLNDLAKFVEMNKVFVYRTVANGRPYLTVLYGAFRDRRSAQDVLDKLPDWLKANRPLLRTVEGIRSEIKRHQAS
jgi:septal ring-binding cell division protein DamX